jgi:hypothetical protein
MAKFGVFVYAVTDLAVSAPTIIEIEAESLDDAVQILTLIVYPTLDQEKRD